MRLLMEPPLFSPWCVLGGRLPPLPVLPAPPHLLHHLHVRDQLLRPDLHVWHPPAQVLLARRRPQRRRGRGHAEAAGTPRALPPPRSGLPAGGAEGRQRLEQRLPDPGPGRDRRVHQRLGV